MKSFDFKRLYRKLRSRCPLFALLAFSLAVLSAGIHLVCLISPTFADFFNINIAGVVRFLLAKITGLVPTSLGELTIFCVPFILLSVILFVIYNTKRERYRLLTRFFAARGKDFRQILQFDFHKIFLSGVFIYKFHLWLLCSAARWHR